MLSFGFLRPNPSKRDQREAAAYLSKPYTNLNKTTIKTV